MTEYRSASKILSDFSLSRLRVTFEAKDHVLLPEYKGSALRGGFGRALRKIVCWSRSATCPQCLLKAKCVYAYVFETLPHDDSPFLRKMTNAPHPFVIRPPLDQRRDYEPGEKLSFDFITIGKAAEHLPYFAYTFVEMGAYGLGRGRGKLALERIESVGFDGELTLVYHHADQILRDNAENQTFVQLTDHKALIGPCTFKFLTPVRIQEKGSYRESVNFGLLFRNLLRRVAVLGPLHCGIDCSGIDFAGLSRAADSIQTVCSDLRWHDWERYSNRQQTRMKLGGLLGEITFEGDFSMFWPFILLGEHVHVGKNTSFGLGHYQLLDP